MLESFNKITPWESVLLFCGDNFNFEHLANPNLKGQAHNKEIETLKTQASAYKAELNIKMKFGKFLSIIEDNFSNLRKPTNANTLIPVSKKLSELAEARIKKENTAIGLTSSKLRFEVPVIVWALPGSADLLDEVKSIAENTWSILHQIFHRIGQTFKGHGFFPTKGEYGLQLAHNMQQMESESYKLQLKQCITGSSFNKGKVPDEMIQKINRLPPEQFKGLINEIVFDNKEEVLCGEQNKLKFYKGLTEEKQAIFYTELLQRKDCFAQIANIVKGANEKEIKKFISIEAIHLFQLNPKLAIDSIEIDSHWDNVLYHDLIEGAIKDYVKDEKYKELETLLNVHLFCKLNGQKGMIDGKLIHLTPDEIQHIENNIKVIHEFWK